VDLDQRPAFIDLRVLPAVALPAAGLEERPVGGHSQLRGRGLDEPVEPDLVLDLGAIMGPVVLGDVQPAGIPVDDERNLGDVTVVDAKGVDPLPAGPLREVAEPLGEAPAQVAELVFDGSRSAPASSGVRRPGRYEVARCVSRCARSSTLAILTPTRASVGRYACSGG
jgi:hypothetical protein